MKRVSIQIAVLLALGMQLGVASANPTITVTPSTGDPGTKFQHTVSGYPAACANAHGHAFVDATAYRQVKIGGVFQNDEPYSSFGKIMPLPPMPAFNATLPVFPFNNYPKPGTYRFALKMEGCPSIYSNVFEVHLKAKIQFIEIQNKPINPRP